MRDYKQCLLLLSLIITLLLISTETFAQITLTSTTSTPLYGDNLNYIRHQDSALQVQHSGANQTWDFSMAGGATFMRSFDSVSSNNTHLQFPQSNLVEEAFPDDDQFYLTSAATLQLVGIYTGTFAYFNYSDYKDVLRFPMSFGDIFIDTYSGQGNSSFGGPSTINSTVEVAVDGHGTLVLPYTSVSNVLRVKTIDNYTIQAGSPPVSSYSDTIYKWYDMANRNYLASYTIRNGQHITHYLQQADFVMSVEPKIAVERRFDLYPNPTTGIVTIEITQPSRIVIFNVTGQVVYSNHEQQRSSTHDLSSLSEGVYYVRAESQEGATVKKLVLVR